MKQLITWAMTSGIFLLFRYLIFTNIHRFGVFRKYDLLLAVTIIGAGYLVSRGIVNVMWERVHEEKLRNILLVVLSAFILIVPVTRISSSKVSPTENRKLAELPSLTVGGNFNYDYGKQFDSWLNDHFRGREKAMNFHFQLEAILTGIVENGRAMEGRNGWLFYKGDHSISNFQNVNPYTEKELETIKEKLEEKKKICEEMGASYYVFIASDKNKVYGEFYPSRYRIVNDMGRGEQLYRYLKEHSDIPVVYPLEALLAGKSKCELYFRNDTHWNEAGAFIGYKELMQVIRKDYPDVAPLRDEDFRIKEIENFGDLQKMLNLPDRKYKTFAMEPILQMPFETTKVDPKQVKLKADVGREYIITENPNQKYRVLIYRDSFCTAMRPFFSRQFGHVEYMWTRNFMKNRSFLQEKKPDIVIEEVVERLSQHLVN